MTHRILSAAQLSTYLGCPRKYAFRYVERVEPEFRLASRVFDSSLRSALEWFHMRMLDRSCTCGLDVVSVFLADWESEQDATLRFVGDESTDTLAALGMTLIRLYMDEFANRPVAAVDVPFEIDLVDLETDIALGDRLRGRFPLLWPDDVVVEIATSARRFADPDLDRRLQLSAYSYAYRRIHGRGPALVVINLVKTDTPALDVEYIERDLDDDAAFVHLAANTVRGIEAGAFPPIPSATCTDCEYRFACSEWRDERLLSLPDRRRLSVVRDTGVHAP